MAHVTLRFPTNGDTVVFSVLGPVISVGRDPALVSIAVADPHVSRHHVDLDLTNRTIVLKSTSTPAVVVHASAAGEVETTLSPADGGCSRYSVPASVTELFVGLPSKQGCRLTFLLGGFESNSERNSTAFFMKRSMDVLRKSHALELSRLEQRQQEQLDEAARKHRIELDECDRAKRQCIEQRERSAATFEEERLAMQQTIEALQQRAATLDGRARQGVAMLLNVLAAMNPDDDAAGLDEDGGPEVNEEGGCGQPCTEPHSMDSDATVADDEGAESMASDTQACASP